MQTVDLRPLTPAERESLWQLVDDCGLTRVVGALVEHCEGQADTADIMGACTYAGEKGFEAWRLRRAVGISQEAEPPLTGEARGGEEA